jgi:two-component system nitrate/nitrite response regulator NarL
MYCAPGPAIRIVIVTDVCLFSEGLAQILGNRPDLEVIASARPGQEILAFIQESSPDAVLVDAATVRASNIASCLAASVGQRKVPVVAFAISEEDEEEVIACVEAGVSGFVARTATVEELASVLISAVHGELRCPPRLTSIVFRRMARLAVGRPSLPDQRGLTQREGEIAALIESGLSNKEIALRLGIEVATVKNHVHSLLEKLRVRRRAEAAALLRAHQRWTPRTVRPAGQI